MAISLLTSTSFSTGSAPVTSSAINTSGASLLIITASNYLPTNTTITISDSQSNSWTLVTCGSAAIQSGNVFYVMSPSTSTSHTFSVTSSNNYAGVQISAWSGTAALQSSTQIETYAASTLQPGSITPSTTGCLLLAYNVFAGGASGTVPYGTVNDSFTSYNPINSVFGTSVGSFPCYLIDSSSTAINPTFTENAAFATANTNDNIAMMLCFLPSTTGVNFVGSTVYDTVVSHSSSGGALVWPSGTVAGNQAILWVTGDTSIALTATGWTTDVNNSEDTGGAGKFYSAFHKASISAGDISSPPTFTGANFGGYCLVVYSGGSGINFGSSSFTSTNTTTVVPGFTKASTSNKIVGIVSTADGFNGVSDVYVQPSGWTQRANTDINYFDLEAADVASSSYTNGTSKTWTGLSSGFDSGGAMWEITATLTSSQLPYRPRPTTHDGYDDGDDRNLMLLRSRMTAFYPLIPHAQLPYRPRPVTKDFEEEWNPLLTQIRSRMNTIYTPLSQPKISYRPRPVTKDFEEEEHPRWFFRTRSTLTSKPPTTNTVFPIVPGFYYPSESLPTFSAANFLQAMVNMLPRGRVWPARDNVVESNQYQTLATWTPSFARSSESANGLVVDIFPPNTDMMLTEWQQSLGLPDPCAGAAQSLTQARDQVVSRFISGGGQSIPYIIAYAAQLGFTITITESSGGFYMGQTAMGDPNRGLGSDPLANVWYVNSQLFTVSLFQMGLSAMGDPLGVVQNNLILECELQAIAPAHTLLLFVYS